jgi:spermidine synthase
VPRVVSTYFSAHNYDVVHNPKVQVRVDDGRHYLLTTKERFDGITSDPFDPRVKGTAALYTREFFEAAKLHLNPGGVLTQFVQLYESSEEAVKSEIATFFEVFPDGTVWANSPMGQGYDLVLIGRVEPTRIDVDKMQQRLNRPEYAPVARSMREIGFSSAVDLLSTYAGQGSDLKAWLKDAAINRDRNLRLQYLAGLRLDLYKGDEIYSHMLAYSRFPENLFTGSEPQMQSLRQSILRTAGH